MKEGRVGSHEVPLEEAGDAMVPGQRPSYGSRPGSLSKGGDVDIKQREVQSMTVEQENETLRKTREDGEKKDHLDIVNSIAQALRKDSHNSPPSPPGPQPPEIHEPESGLETEQDTPPHNSPVSSQPSDRLRDFTFPPRSLTPSSTALPTSPLPDILLEDSPWGK